MVQRLAPNEISIQVEEYFDVLVLLQFSCFRKYVGLDLVQTGSLGFLFLMGLIYSSVKSLILVLGQRGHIQQNSCLFPIRAHGSLGGLSVVVISRATVEVCSSHGAFVPVDRWPTAHSDHSLARAPRTWVATQAEVYLHFNYDRISLLSFFIFPVHTNDIS